MAFFCEHCKSHNPETSCVEDGLNGWPYGSEQERSLKDDDCHKPCCPDCGVAIGGLHHIGCDYEICRECGKQMIDIHLTGCSVYAKFEGDDE